MAANYAHNNYAPAHSSKLNVLIAGTPGVGKSTHAVELTNRLNYKYININEVAKEGNFYEGWDPKLQTNILSEELALDEIEPAIKLGGCVVDYHSCDLFPEEWFNIIFVLRTDNTILYERLEKRGYNQAKLTENIECEIMQVLLEEAREHYGLERVYELNSNTVDDVDNNINNMIKIINLYISQ